MKEMENFIIPGGNAFVKVISAYECNWVKVK